MATRAISYREAVNEALAQEMERDPSVIVMGEDVAGGVAGDGDDDAWGGVLGVTKGLYPKFPDRVLDTPITESGFIGAAVGAATRGLRPVAELMFIDFMGVCFDQIFNQAAKFKYMFGGKAETPIVIRAMCGAGFRAADFFFAPPFRAAAEVLLAFFTAFFRPPVAEPFRFAITRSFRTPRNQQLP